MNPLFNIFMAKSPTVSAIVLLLLLVLGTTVAFDDNELSAPFSIQYNYQLPDKNGFGYIKDDQFRFGVDEDGNLYLTGGLPPTIFANAGPGATLNMQGDGNLVLYSALGDAVFSSGTAGYHGAKIYLDDGDGFAKIEAVDGNIIKEFRPEGCIGLQLPIGQRLLPGEFICFNKLKFGLSKNGKVSCGIGENLYEIDHPGTANNLAMQKDGNLVAYGDSATPVWSSNTDGNPVSAVYLVSFTGPKILNSAGNEVWNFDCTANL